MTSFTDGFFRAIVENLREGLWVADAQHRFVYANAAMAGIAGVPVDAIVGKHVLEDIPAERRGQFTEHFLAAVDSLRPQAYTSLVTAIDGRRVWLGGWLVPQVEEGRYVGMIGTARDITAEKITEDQSRENEALLRTVLDEFPDPVLLKDYKGDFLLCNQAVARLYNTTPEAMVGKHDDDFGVPKEMADFFRENVLGIMARGEAEIVLEASRNAVSGEIHHYKSIKKPFKDGQGINQILVIAQDITDIVRGQQRVAESERRLQDVLRVAQEAVWDWHLPSGRVLHNAQWYMMLGAEEGEILATLDAFAEMAHPDDRALVWERVQALVEGKADTYYSEHRLVGKKGTLWVEDRGGVTERDEQGNPVRVTGAFLDIAARREAEAKLANILEEQQAILHSEVVGFVMLEGRQMAWMNKAFANMLGYEQTELVGGSTRILYPDEAEYLALRAAADPVLAAGGVFRAQAQYVRKDGALGWHDMSGARLHLHDDRSIWACVDITAQKRTEAELIAAQQAAQQASLAKSQFLATMSHELRTPMNGVLGMAQLLMLPDIDERTRLSYAETIINSGQTLMTLLNDILDLTRVEAGKVELAPAEFLPGQVVADIATLFGEPARTKGLDLNAAWHGPWDEGYLADPVRVRQMLSNLISNAIKFTRQGYVRLEAREVAREGAWAELEFSVSDSGIGVPRDKQSLLFQAFSQVDGSATREFGGTGLGLSIVRGLAELMEGDVGVESQTGKGSRFWFRIRAEVLPRAPTQPGGMVVGEMAGVSRMGRVLVVEDNATNRILAEAFLERLGLSVTSVENGQLAVDALTSGERPDLVLMDVQMPVLDGLRATERIRQWERETGQPRLPIIALTAGAFQDDRRNCEAAGMDDYLSKPIKMRELADLLEKWLPLSG